MEELKAIFPDMSLEALGRALEASGGSVERAADSLLRTSGAGGGEESSAAPAAADAAANLATVGDEEVARQLQRELEQEAAAADSFAPPENAASTLPPAPQAATAAAPAPAPVAPQGRGTSVTLPHDFLRAPGVVSDEQLALMLQNADLARSSSSAGAAIQSRNRPVSATNPRRTGMGDHNTLSSSGGGGAGDSVMESIKSMGGEVKRTWGSFAAKLTKLGAKQSAAETAGERSAQNMESHLLDDADAEVVDLEPDHSSITHRRLSSGGSEGSGLALTRQGTAPSAKKDA